MIQIGDIEITYVTDGTMYVDVGGAFGLVPRALYRKYFEPDADNMIPMTLHCLLVKVAGKTVVVDTGFGEKLTEQMKQTFRLQRQTGGLVDGLARMGIRPGDVDMVIDSH